jgi:hypothetical protein
MEVDAAGAVFEIFRPEDELQLSGLGVVIQMQFQPLAGQNQFLEFNHFHMVEMGGQLESFAGEVNGPLKLHDARDDGDAGKMSREISQGFRDAQIQDQAVAVHSFAQYLGQQDWGCSVRHIRNSS